MLLPLMMHVGHIGASLSAANIQALSHADVCPIAQPLFHYDQALQLLQA